MTTKVLDISPIPGMHEDVAPGMAPPGTLTLAQNVRWRQGNRIEKRYGSSEVSASSGSQPQGANDAVGWVGSLGNTLLFGLVDTNGSGSDAVYQHSGTQATGPFFNLGEQSQCKPLGRYPYARDDSTAGGARQRSVQAAFGHVFCAWDDATNTSLVALRSDGAVVWAAAKFAAVGTRLVLANSRLWLVTSTGTALEVREITQSGATFALGGATNIGTLSAAGSPFDATSGGIGNRWVVAYRSAATTVTTKLMTNASVTTTQTSAATTSINRIGIGATSGENIYVGWVDSDGADNTIAAHVFDNTATTISPVAGPTVLDTAGTDEVFGGQVAWNRLSSSSYTCIWGAYAATYGFTRRRSYNTAAAVGAAANLWIWELASKPFRVAGKDYFWAQSDPSSGPLAGWAAQRRYALFELSSNELQALIVGQRSNYQASIWLCDVPQLNDRHYFSAQHTLRQSGAGSGAETTGLDLYAFAMSASVDGSSNPYIGNRQRTTAQVNSAGLISGGALQELDGDSTASAIAENNFCHQPAFSVAASAGAGLTSGTLYTYCVVSEQLDSLGQRHRSAPSVTATVTPSSTNLRATLTLLTLAGSGRPGYVHGDVTQHVYRSWGGGPFYRVTPDQGAPSALVASGAVSQSYVDSMSDATAATKEILYTDGGVFGNDPPDGCAMLAMGADRAYVVGWDRRYVQCSKIIVQGEPVQFVNSSAFWIPLPEPATGLAYVDGSLLVYTLSGAYVIYVDGAGPNDQGVGSFGTLRSLPSNSGCIDERSVCVTAAGVFHQSRNTISLTPRGFGPAIPVGDAVQNTLEDYPVIAGATLVSDGQGERVHFLALTADAASTATENSRILVYDLQSNAWAIDRHASNARVGAVGAVQGNFHYATANTGANGQVRRLLSSSTTELNASAGSETFEQRLEFAELRPFGPCGFGHIQTVAVQGEWLGECVWNISATVDDATAEVADYTLSTDYDQMYRTIVPSRANGTALTLKLYDSAYVGVMKGFGVQAISLLVNPKPGLRPFVGLGAGTASQQLATRERK